ncbi:MAG TPA: winged helix-turn-helix transcriptional regulator [Dermatophilaceae bacterium]|nr:winged helix-turn-helix transcriptional regulator [Dermatophilaceae bacterium]
MAQSNTPPPSISPPNDSDGLDAAARVVGDRWTLRLIGALLDADRTFGELASDLTGIAPTILTARLRTLQGLGLLTATPYQRRPPRMRYSLTAPGRRLAAVIATLAEWGAAREGTPGRPRHRSCGTPVVTRQWCPTCDEPVDHGDQATGEELVWC